MMDIEMAQDMVNSLMWTNVVKELDYRLEGAMEALRHANKDTFEKIQHKIEFYEEMKRLPEDVISREES